MDMGKGFETVEAGAYLAQAGRLREMAPVNVVPAIKVRICSRKYTSQYHSKT